MSTFRVPVVTTIIRPHPAADRLEIGQVAGYQTIVPKGLFRSGDLAAYLPEDAVVPDSILDELGLRGKLAGPAANRIRAQKFRGILSQGLLYPARAHWREHDDVQTELGVVKYLPPIPPHFKGDVYNPGREALLSYDIENYQVYPDLLHEGEPVVLTEKLHGTCVQISVVPESMQDAHHVHGRVLVSSKGLASEGLAFSDTPPNTENLYLRAAKQAGLADTLIQWYDRRCLTIPFILIGEIIGRKVQDLAYGHEIGGFSLRIFDAFIGTRFEGHYLSDGELSATLADLSLSRVPVLARGPYSHDWAASFLQGPETVTGQSLHTREGIIIRPCVEREDLLRGRVILKWKSEHYLLRQDGTEYQ